MVDSVILFQDNFQSFSIGPFPFDREHSAMGEYHYDQQPGYRGQWYDPITNCNYRGPSWLVTATDGVHYMEQTRVRNPLTHGVCPVLVTGDDHWQDYTMTVTLRTLRSDEEAGILFRYQTSLMHYAFFLNGNKIQFWRVNKTERTMLAQTPFEYNGDEYYTISVVCKGNTFTGAVNGNVLLTVQDDCYTYGKVALAAYMPTQYTNVQVTTTQEEAMRIVERQDAEQARLAEKRSHYPRPKLHKVIDLKEFGASRQIRFGHLMGGK